MYTHVNGFRYRVFGVDTTISSGIYYMRVKCTMHVSITTSLPGMGVGVDSSYEHTVSSHMGRGF